jgi:ABC-2 type transport system permease protein
MSAAVAAGVGPGAPGRMFARLRGRLLCNTLRAMFAAGSLRPLTIAAASLVIWAFVFGVSYAGFLFLQEQRIALGGGIVGLLFDVLFFALAVMLLFSSGLILYSSLFSSAETSFLLSTPAAADQVFAFKFHGAVAFSSWAFLLLGAPVLIAFGLTYPAPWYFYVLLVFFFLGFVLIPGSLGALACLLIVNYFPQRKKQVLALLVAVGLALAALWAYRVAGAMRPTAWNKDAVQRLLGRFELTQAALLPSHWVAWGLRAAARGEPGKALYHLTLVWANGLFLYLAAAWLARRLYRRGFDRTTTGGTLRRRYGGHFLDRALERALFFVGPQTRLLIVKDFRTFRRDPAQWAQVLIFSGLMTLYFINVRRLFVSDITWAYQNSISLLNLSAVALLLCTYTGRFVYPLLSLEGKKFWVLGLLPLRRERLLWGKFAFATTGALLIAEALVLLSDLMLGMPPGIVLLHVLAMAVLAAGLSGLSVGLGALMPNFRETDPSKIAAGFGGTLNLVAGLLYLILILGLMAGPWHAVAALNQGNPFGPVETAVVITGAALGVLAGAAAVAIPLYYGAHNLRRMEF